MPTITLPSRCDRAAVQELLPDMVAASHSGPITIDASQVEQAGQALLQLLLSARQSASGAAITPSPALAEAGRMAGLSEALFGAPQA